MNTILEYSQQIVSIIPGGIGKWILAALFLIGGYFLSKLVRKLVEKALGATQIDEKLAKLIGAKTEGSEKGVGAFVFWLLMLFFAILALNALELQAATKPLLDVLDQIVGFIPNLLAAAAIGFVAWILAVVLKNIVTGVLSAARVDERLKLGDSKPLTNSLGIVTFWGIILFLIPQVLNALKLKTISEPITATIGQIFDYVPFLLGGIAIFAIGYVVADIVRKVLTNLLESIGTDSLPKRLGYSGGNLIGGKTLSDLLGVIAMATILVIISVQAIRVLNLEFISALAANIIPAYFNILAALIIIAVALYVANIVGQLIEPKSAFWAKVARVAILVFLGAVALQKANISSLTNETFQLAITALIIAAAFALGVGGAIALGLGGRERAQSWLSKWK